MEYKNYLKIEKIISKNKGVYRYVLKYDNKVYYLKSKRPKKFGSIKDEVLERLFNGIMDIKEVYEFTKRGVIPAIKVADIAKFKR